MDVMLMEFYRKTQITGMLIQGCAGPIGNGEALDQDSLLQFIAQMSDQQFAIGIQSFTNTDTKLLRGILEKAA